MVEIESYTGRLLEKLKERFGGRLVYLGLQGSYLRGEAGENSDIDIMAVLNELTLEDMDAYRAVVEEMEESGRACGFICSREDLRCWNRCEIGHLLHTTKDLYGRLAELTPDYSPEDVREYVRILVGNLYHGICHPYIHSADPLSGERLEAAYKQVFFILQNKQYLESGLWGGTKRELLGMLQEEDGALLGTAMRMGTEGAPVDEAERRALLRQIMEWCQRTLEWARQVK